jgi:hypothetical protein
MMDAKTILNNMENTKTNAENQNNVLKKEGEQYVQWLKSHNGDEVRAVLANLVKVKREIRKNKHIIKQDTFTYPCKSINRYGVSCKTIVTLTKEELTRISDSNKTFTGEDLTRFWMLDKELCYEHLHEFKAHETCRQKNAERKNKIIEKIGTGSVKVNIINISTLQITNEKGEIYEMDVSGFVNGIQLKKVEPK